MLFGAVFSAIGMMRGPHWNLLPEERDSIATATADLLEAMPDTGAAKTAQVMEKFAAPVALATALGGAVVSRVVMEQHHLAELRQEAARQARIQQAQQAQAQQPRQEITNVFQPETTQTTDPRTAESVGIAQELHGDFLPRHA